eukprot:scaffold211415_cov39-Prasinocladus_malaysianus.AAC.1
MAWLRAVAAAHSGAVLLLLAVSFEFVHSDRQHKSSFHRPPSTGPVLAPAEKYKEAHHLRDGTHELTARGRSIRRVVFVSMVPGVCRSVDWRGDLPRWFARFMPHVRFYQHAIIS